MSNHNLTYSISKRTPASPKVLKEILDAQSIVNRACTWSHERLALAVPKETGRAAFAFPLMRLGLGSGPTPALPDGFGAPAPAFSVDAFAQGSTRVRDLWNAHLVAAFLKYVSRTNPSLLLDLRDETGFVLTGSVWLRGGNVEANREFINRERGRVLELTGDPQAAAPFLWAELQAISGMYFADAPARDYEELPEVQELDLGWNDLETLSIADLASLVVERAVKHEVPAKT